MALNEQEAVYDSQSKVFPFWGQTFYSIHEIASYLTKLMDTEWFFAQFGPTPQVALKEWKDRNRWAGCADAKTFTIYLKKGNQAESTILHELAHLLCGSGDHGQCFVDTQLILIRQQMGFHAYSEYRNALLETGVFTPTVRPLPKEQNHG